MYQIRHIGRILLKSISAVAMVALMTIIATSISLVYEFGDIKPFKGPDIFNPYRNIDSPACWKRANFHTHTKVQGLLNECDYWPEQVDEAYRKFGYDIVTFSNHNQLTEHPYDERLQVNVYEHGYNLLKFHKLVFGTEKELHFDHILPLFTFQKQFQLDLLAKDSDFIQFNHPLRTDCLTRRQLQKLAGYSIMELDSGKSTENEYWDWALSAGIYSFGLANDDLHYPDRTYRMAVRSNFLCCPSAEYEDIKRVLLEGGYYSMRIPDYGNGDWDIKYEKNRSLPYIEDIGLSGNTIFLTLSESADSIKIFGQDHTLLSKVVNTDSMRYEIKDDEPYARFTAWFPEGEVIYTNPFARYDSAVADSPFRNPDHKVNILMTVLYNLLLLALLAGTVLSFKKLVLKK